MRRITLALAVTALLAVAVPARAAVAPPRGEPPLSAPGLAASLSCPADVAAKRPVLLIPGTTLDPSEYTWNYLRSLPAAGFAVCTVDLPQHALGDIQVAAEYVVNAIRTIRTESHQKVAVVGHSQGGMIPRWALKWWPDTRGMVSDVIGLAPSNHGTTDTDVICHLICPPSFWQQASTSAFMRALNTGPETYAGIDYTVVYTHTDEVVTPNTSDAGSSALRTGAGTISDVALQSICPLDVSEHLAIGTYDPVAYALVIDALTHPGPAQASRISRAVCSQLVQPGVQLSRFPANEAKLLADVALSTATGPETTAEPALQAYAR